MRSKSNDWKEDESNNIFLSSKINSGECNKLHDQS
jgi:hypothetical protein